MGVLDISSCAMLSVPEAMEPRLYPYICFGFHTRLTRSSVQLESLSFENEDNPRRDVPFSLDDLALAGEGQACLRTREWSLVSTKPSVLYDAVQEAWTNCLRTSHV